MVMMMTIMMMIIIIIINIIISNVQSSLRVLLSTYNPTYLFGEAFLRRQKFRLMYFPGIQLEIYSSVVSPTWGIDGIITSFFLPYFLLVCDMFIHFHHFSKAFSKTLPRIWRGSNSKHSAGIGKCCHPWIDHLVGRLLTSSSVGQDLWDAQHPQWNFHHADVSEEAFRSRLYFCHLVVAMA